MGLQCWGLGTRLRTMGDRVSAVPRAGAFQGVGPSPPKPAKSRGNQVLGRPPGGPLEGHLRDGDGLAFLTGLRDISGCCLP